MVAMAVDVRELGVAAAGPPLPSGPDGWSVADLELLPDDGPRYELLDGTLLVSPAPNRGHQRVTRSLLLLLAASCTRDLEVFTAPLDWQPGEGRSFQPDLLVIPRGPASDPVSNPVLLVEIVSPSTAAIDRTVKLHAYAEAGARQYWIVDPGAEENGSDCAVEVYDLVDGAYVLQVRGGGADELAVRGPVPVQLIPAELTR